METESSRWPNTLNPEQREAALHDEGPMLVLACAGSGKTTVLVARTGRLIERGIVPSKKLAVLTFTNKSARELKHRVAAKLGDMAEGLFAGTFHSFGVHLLRRFHKEAGLPKEFAIVDSSDAGGIVKELLLDFRIGDKTKYDADKLLSVLSSFREKGQREAQRDDEYEVAVEWLLPRYEQRLQSLGVVDFDGLLLKPLELLEKDGPTSEAIQNRFRMVMVDEFQDTNALQMRLLAKLVAPHKNLSVVGDDDQAIYGWRGAQVANILDFPRVYPGTRVVSLERNYRSRPAILKLANAILVHNKERHVKVLRAEGKEDDGAVPEMFVYDTEAEEAENVASEIASLIEKETPRGSIAALYRSNGQGALLEAELRRLSVPYAISGGTAFFDRREVRDVLAFLRCAVHPNDVAARRVLNVPSRGIGDKSAATLGAFADSQGVRFLAAARRWRDAGLDDRAGAALEEFLEECRALETEVLDITEPPASARLLKWLDSIGYRTHLEKLAGDSLIAGKRWKVLEVFAGILDRFLHVGKDRRTSLREFLQAMELRDEGDDKSRDKVQLLTLHACKGLEFPHVFLLGLEEDMLPHKRLGSDVSEERRLFYVGVTRAQERLILTRCKTRQRQGKRQIVPPSRFLIEVGEGLWKEYEGSRPVQQSDRKRMMAALFAKLDSLDKPPEPTL